MVMIGFFGLIDASNFGPNRVSGLGFGHIWVSAPFFGFPVND